MKPIISAVSDYLKQTHHFIAVMLIGMTFVSVGAEPSKLMPLPPIAPGLQLSRLFNDHMVLQRETKVKVWGWAAAGEKVAVEFAGQTKSATTAADGSWLVALDPMEKPVAARFGWSLRPFIKLWTVSGLPVSPFRTDNWPNQ